MEKIWRQSYPDSMPRVIKTDSYLNLVEMLLLSVEKNSNATAYINMGEKLTFDELEKYSRYFATYLNRCLKLKQGQRVALMLPNTFQYPIAMFGILRAGLTVVNVNPQYTPHELIHQLNDSGATTIVVLSSFAANLQQVVKETKINKIILTNVGDLFPYAKRTFLNIVLKYIKRLIPAFHLPHAIGFRKALELGSKLSFVAPYINGGDVAFLQYTGGTTGVAKGAVLTHRNVVSNVLQAKWVASHYIEEGNKQKALLILPLYHAFALTVNCLLFIEMSLTSVLITNPRDIKGVIKVLDTHKVVAITALNTLFNAWLDNEKFRNLNFSKLKLTVSGGMALQPRVAERWYEVTGNKILVGYGMTEASPLISACVTESSYKSGTIGLPVANTDVKIVDEEGIEVALGEAGELCVKGEQVMQGYWLQPEETMKVLHDGWLRTGDIVIMDKDFQLRIVDRKKDMIVVSGFNVYPSEIEGVVMLHPQVQEAAVIGIPHPTSGESVKLFVVKNDPSLTVQALREHCAKYLTGYKLPREIAFCDDLPKSHIGKVLRRKLREEELAKLHQLKTA